MKIRCTPFYLILLLSARSSSAKRYECRSAAWLRRCRCIAQRSERERDDAYLLLFLKTPPKTMRDPKKLFRRCCSISTLLLLSALAYYCFIIIIACHIFIRPVVYILSIVCSTESINTEHRPPNNLLTHASVRTMFLRDDARQKMMPARPQSTQRLRENERCLLRDARDADDERLSMLSYLLCKTSILLRCAAMRRWWCLKEAAFHDAADAQPEPSKTRDDRRDKRENASIERPRKPPNAPDIRPYPSATSMQDPSSVYDARDDVHFICLLSVFILESGCLSAIVCPYYYYYFTSMRKLLLFILFMSVIIMT